jgi:hypothetical protein
MPRSSMPASSSERPFLPPPSSGRDRSPEGESPGRFGSWPHRGGDKVGFAKCAGLGARGQAAWDRGTAAAAGARVRVEVDRAPRCAGKAAPGDSWRLRRWLAPSHSEAEMDGGDSRLRRGSRAESSQRSGAVGNRNRAQAPDRRKRPPLLRTAQGRPAHPRSPDPRSGGRPPRGRHPGHRSGAHADRPSDRTRSACPRARGQRR